MVQMGALVPTGDMTVVRRTAQFFLNSFEERLVAQRKKKEMATTELGFKKQLSKEERLEKKKQRLAAIGDQSTIRFDSLPLLDGIGKGLDPRFDITEIAKPYAMELLRFREAGFEVLVKVPSYTCLGMFLVILLQFSLLRRSMQNDSRGRWLQLGAISSSSGAQLCSSRPQLM
ncbi:hypothetical protein Taro_002628, partial [Colocasia esculenta]|nr:hypothetical protein [Colocasia esculenta]